MRYRQPQYGRIALNRSKPLTSGLQGAWSYYQGNQASSLLDLSGTANAGTSTLVAAPSTEITTRGKALSFNGTTQYVSFGTPNTTLSGTFTVSAWVYSKDATTEMCFIGSRTSFAGCDFKIKLGTTIHADIGDGSNWVTTSADGSFTYAINTWYHIVYVVTPTDYTIYANGVNVGSGSYASATPLLWDSSHTLNIGQNGTGNEFFNGLIDQILIYDRELSAYEVFALYSNPWQLYEDVARIRKPAASGTQALTPSLFSNTNTF